MNAVVTRSTLKVAKLHGVLAGPGDDQLDGGDGHDTILGLGGQDTINGFAGSDSLDGGSGSDIVSGAAGNDTIIGGGGNDLLSGDSGINRINAGDGNDEVNFDFGDTVDGGAGVDTLYAYGEMVDGVLVHEGGVIDGGDDNDEIVDNTEQTGPVALTLSGGAGDDAISYNGERGDALSINGGSGFDTFRWYGGTAVEDIVNFEKLLFSHSPASLTLNNRIIRPGLRMEFQSSLRATLDATAETDGSIYFHGYGETSGNAGETYADFVLGSAGDDCIDGGKGNDTLQGNGGNDTIIGGVGTDIAVYSGALADYLVETVVGGTVVTHLHSGADGKDELSSIDRLQFSDQTVVVETPGKVIAGTDAGERLRGEDGGDTISGLRGRDEINGFGGNDLLDGGGDPDSVYGGPGDDTVFGGAGDDLLSGHTGLNQISGEEGNDEINFDFGDTVDGGAGSDTLYAYGETVVGVLVHEGGVVNGGDDNDYLVDNTEQTGAVALTLLGGAGDDEISYDGAAGDALSISGGPGFDTFRWSGGTVIEEIVNFEKIQFTQSPASLTLNNRIIGAGLRMEFHPSARVTLDATAETDGSIYFNGLNETSSNAGESYADSVLGSVGNDCIDGGKGNDTLQGNGGDDTIIGGTGTDIAVYSGALADYRVETVAGGAVVTHLNSGPDGKDRLSGIDRVEFSDNTIAMETPGKVVTGTNADESLRGEDGGDTISGLRGRDEITGFGGNDSLDGGGDSDSVSGGFGDDTVLGGAGDDLLSGNSGLNQVSGEEGNDEINFDFADTVNGGTGSDTLYAYGEMVGAVLVHEGGLINGGDGNDYIVDSTEQTGAVALTLLGGAGDDEISYEGEAGDALSINGGFGFDTFRWYEGSAIQSILNFERIVLVHPSLTLDNTVTQAGARMQIEAGKASTFDATAETDGSIYFRGYNEAGSNAGESYADSVLGSAGNDCIEGGKGNDTLQGNGGNDTILGAVGADIAVYSGARADYSLDTVDAGLQVTHLNGGNDGTDLLRDINEVRFSDTSETIPVINLYLVGTDGDDVLVGGEGADSLDGEAGEDTLEGAGGNDVFHVDNSQDQVKETSGGGKDLVVSTSDYVLPSNAEDLNLMGDAEAGSGNSQSNNVEGNSSANDLLGLSGNDTLEGNSGEDTLAGGSGNDSLSAGAGSDILVGDSGNDNYQGDAGRDTIQYTAIASAIDLDLAAGMADSGANGSDTLAGIENATGGKSGDSLIGNGQDNLLDGFKGADTLTGGGGNDRYVVDNIGDVVREAGASSNEIDAVKSAVDWTLGRNVEQLVLSGSRNIDGLGNALDNNIRGNVADNVLKGGEGIDTLMGGGGNDIYVVNNDLDVVRELSSAPGGIDLVQTTTDWELKANFESLTLNGSADVDGTGNGLANRIEGNSGDNVLRGRTGDDTLAGGAAPGAGEIDEIAGGLGEDLFVLGDGNRAFYRDDNTAAKGLKDYAQIVDFSVDEDRLRLHGDASDYHLGASPFSSAPGRALYREEGSTDELIAVVQSSNSTSLTFANMVAEALFSGN